ncbi:MAG: hypothetical protein ACXW29_01770 [Thermoanaerobaculia bacterium]
MRVRLSLIAVFLLVAIGASAQSARKIPGITTKDAFPRACVDCHTGRAGMTPAPLSTVMKEWSAKIDGKRLARLQTFVPKSLMLKGKHPGVATIKDVPASCVKCHTTMSKLAPPLAPLIHGIHLTGGDANSFLTTFQGECTHCHKLNAVSGQWSMPGGAEK